MTTDVDIGLAMTSHNASTAAAAVFDACRWTADGVTTERRLVD
jgi:hypothetical protein